MADLERIVHAVMFDGSEIVRYDRAGKWYREFSDNRMRTLLTVGEAAWYGARAEVCGLNQYGGAVFTRLVVKESELVKD